MEILGIVLVILGVFIMLTPIAYILMMPLAVIFSLYSETKTKEWDKKHFISIFTIGITLFIGGIILIIKY